jgi:hypothetical protein
VSFATGALFMKGQNDMSKDVDANQDEAYPVCSAEETLRTIISKCIRDFFFEGTPGANRRG